MRRRPGFSRIQRCPRASAATRWKCCASKLKSKCAERWATETFTPSKRSTNGGFGNFLPGTDKTMKTTALLLTTGIGSKPKTIIFEPNQVERVLLDQRINRTTLKNFLPQ